MKLFSQRDNHIWIPVLGVLLFIGMMTVGYFYNLTFVQLGLIDFGERILGLSRQRVAMDMALLAVVTTVTALWVGWQANKHRWGFDLILRLRLSFLVILCQTVLTFTLQNIQTETWFVIWLLGTAVVLGLGVPVTFSMTVDLVPRKWRGEAAALITSGAYLAANLVPASWQVEDLAYPFYFIMPFGLAGLGALVFIRWPFLETLANQHREAAFARGRYAPVDVSSQRIPQRLLGFVSLMFIVFFVDSLGFLRMLETPRLMVGAWQSVQVGARLVIGIVHVIGALIAGVLYDVLDVKKLFYWIFGIFSLVHLMYTFSLRLPGSTTPLSMPVLYALAVSIYTVVNFALWADVSTPATVGLNAAIGVAFSGWAATFISTALAVTWETNQVPLDRHLNIVDSIAMLAFVGMILVAWWPRRELDRDAG